MPHLQRLQHLLLPGRALTRLLVAPPVTHTHTNAQTGLSEDRVSEILTQPVALLADLSWAPGLFLADDDDGDEDDAAAAAAAGDGAEGSSSSSSSGSGSINDMTFMQLAKVRVGRS